MKKDKDNPDQLLEKVSNFVIFQTATGKVNIDVFFHDETLWLSQKKIAELFEKGRSTITEHLKNIFNSAELDESSVCRDFRHTAEDGKEYKTKYYNLKAITAVGYRVNSHRATEFRKWATTPAAHSVRSAHPGGLLVSGIRLCRSLHWYKLPATYLIQAYE